MSFTGTSDPYPADDTGPDFDTTETMKAHAYRQHVIDIATLRLAAYQRLLPPSWNPYWQLVHRMRPVMASTPVPAEDVSY